MLNRFASHLSDPRRRQLVLLLGLMLIGSVAEMVSLAAVIPFISMLADPDWLSTAPVFYGAFNAVGVETEQSLQLAMVLMFLLFVLLAGSIRLILSFATNRFVYAVGRDLGIKLYERIISQPYAYHIGENSSDVIGRMNMINTVINGFMRPIMDGAVAMILALAIISALVVINPKLAMIATFTFGFLYLTVSAAFRVKLKSNGTIVAHSEATRVRLLQEGLGGIRDVILAGTQGLYVGAFASVELAFRRAQASNAFLAEAPRFIIEFIGIVLMVTLAYFLARDSGGLMDSLPVLAALALGAAKLLPLIQKIYAAWAQYSGNYRVMREVLIALDLPIPPDEGAADPAFQFKHGIRIEHLCFHYGNSPNHPVLTNVNVYIPKGARVGVFGKTGAGKSTLMDIIMGLLTPTNGRILVDDVELHAGNREAWRALIANVSQHVYLADASIRENIAISRPELNDDDARISDAAELAQLTDFIASTRRQYDTPVGERGVQLSGGQRQRIGIARAFFKGASILVLDEASSALDSRTEAAIMSSISHLGREVTIFIIAHRTQVLQDCDILLEVAEGRVVERDKDAMMHGWGDSRPIGEIPS